MQTTDVIQPETHKKRTSETHSDLGHNATREISNALRPLLADVFALYVKTKNFHWHMTGRHFRDYHLLLDEHGDQIFAMTDEIAERARKLGGPTLRSIGDVSRHQTLKDNNAELLPQRKCWSNFTLITCTSHDPRVRPMKSATGTTMSRPPA